jgi:hypothetical protein
VGAGRPRADRIRPSGLKPAGSFTRHSRRPSNVHTSFPWLPVWSATGLRRKRSVGMQHTDYEIRLLVEQRRGELIAQAERLNQLHGARGRERRKHFRSLLIRFRLPAEGAPGATLTDVRS